MTIRTLTPLVVVGTIIGAATAFNGSTTTDVGGGITSTRQSTDSLIGGCGPVYEQETTPGTAGIIPTVLPDGKTPNTPTYATIVPMTGPFWATPANPTTRMYTPSSPAIPKPAQLVHNMWSGALIVFYTARTDPEDINKLRTIAETRTDLNLIIAPWDVTRGPLPSDRKIAFATWGASQTCQRLIVVALNQFAAAHPTTGAPGHRGQTPRTLPSAPAPRQH